MGLFEILIYNLKSLTINFDNAHILNILSPDKQQQKTLQHFIVLLNIRYTFYIHTSMTNIIERIHS